MSIYSRPRWFRTAALGQFAGLWLLLVGGAGLAASFFITLPLPPDSDQVLVGPGQPGHPLGTDELGRDVGASLLLGCRTALVAGVPPVILGMLVGVILGSLAGFGGNSGRRLPVGYLLGAGLFLLLLLTAWSLVGKSERALRLSFVFFLGISLAALLFNRRRWRGHTVALPLDTLVMRLAVLVGAVPRLVWVLWLAAYTELTPWRFGLLTGLLYWPEPARLLRTELQRIRQLPYLDAARSLGLPPFYILVRHALPNALPPLVINASAGIASLLSLEATLSFLGVGIPPDVPSWGRLAAGFRSHPEAWWLAVGPGLLLSVTVLSLYVVADALIQRLDPRRRQFRVFEK